MADNAGFSCLPIAVRDSLLQQAFKQLNQRHLFGVAPRVCRLWHKLAVRITRTSLKVTIRTAEAADQFALWMKSYGTTLESLDLHVRFLHRLSHWREHSVCNTPALQSSLQAAVGSAHQIRSLTISTPSLSCTLNITLLDLTSLTSLRIKGCDFTVSSIPDSIPSVTTLRNLSLEAVCSETPWGPFMQQIATSLLQLKKLELAHSSMDVESLAQLRPLPQLQQLQLRRLFPAVRASQLSKLVPLPISTIIIVMEKGAEAGVCSWMQQSAASLCELLIRNPEGYDDFDSSLIPPLIPLQHAPLLRHLTLVGMAPNMAHLGALTQLTRLDLITCGLDDAAIMTLAGLSELLFLDLHGNKDVSGAGGSMEVLAKGMPDLEDIRLGSMSAVTAAIAVFGFGEIEGEGLR